MRHLPSRFRRLDDALADLPLDEPMLLTELDGFLTGIVVSPILVTPGEWMQGVWGSDEGGVAPFEDPLDVQWFADAVMARHNEILRDLGRGKLQPIFDVDERNGEVLWEPWIGGFAEAMALRSDEWETWAGPDEPDCHDALARLSMLIAIAHDESELDSVQVNAIQDEAPADLVAAVLRLHAARVRRQEAPSTTSIGVSPARVGRNEPCRCGSGRKSKRCCG